MSTKQSPTQATTFAIRAIAFVCVLLPLFLFVVHTGCKKDGLENSNNTAFGPAFDRNDIVPTVTHNMLHFNSMSEMTEFMKQLQDKEADTTQVKNAYTALGINVNSGSIPNLTDNPVCLRTEQTTGGYTSARKAEETTINAALNQGTDVFSIVLDPYFKTAINIDRAVQIGSRIYKYYPNGGMAIVLNDDWTLYDAVKTQSFESLKQAFNLIVTSDARVGWDKFFTMNADGSVGTEKRVFTPLFSVINSSGKLAISNVSLVETVSGSNTFKWTYSDGTVSFGQNPNKAINQNESLTLTINNGFGTITILTEADILACVTDYFTITNLTGNSIRFDLPGFVPGPTAIYNIRWLFSDGQTAFNVNPVVKTFTANGNATCQMIRKTDGTVACEFTKPYFINCGEKKSKSLTVIRTVNGQTWKLDCSIWVLSNEAGCRTKYLKRGIFGLWLPANNQGACSDLSGTYKREVNSPSGGKSCNNAPGNGSKCLGEGTYPTSVSFTIADPANIFREVNMLSSGHKIKVLGTWFGPGFDMPRLVLD